MLQNLLFQALILSRLRFLQHIVQSSTTRSFYIFIARFFSGLYIEHQLIHVNPYSKLQMSEKFINLNHLSGKTEETF